MVACPYQMANLATGSQTKADKLARLRRDSGSDCCSVDRTGTDSERLSILSEQSLRHSCGVASSGLLCEVGSGGRSILGADAPCNTERVRWGSLDWRVVPWRADGSSRILVARADHDSRQFVDLVGRSSESIGM